MADTTNEEKLDAAVAMRDKIDVTLSTLYEKTASATSFGDQSRTLASINELEKSREYWRTQITQLQAAVNSHRKTLKIQFR